MKPKKKKQFIPGDRNEVMRKVFMALQMLMRPGGCTAAELQKALKVTNRTAHRYINSAKEVLDLETSGVNPVRYFLRIQPDASPAPTVNPPPTGPNQFKTTLAPAPDSRETRRRLYTVHINGQTVGQVWAAEGKLKWVRNLKGMTVSVTWGQVYISR